MAEASGFPLPYTNEQTPGFPASVGALGFQEFAGLNTKATRPAIKDEEVAWVSGFMLIGPGNARTLYGLGDSLYAASGGLTIPWFNFGNIGTSPLCAVLLSDGSVQQVNTETGVVTQIMPPGTVLNPEPIFGFSQWGRAYLLFAAQQTNGYWIWDGTTLFSEGGLAPQVTITAAGTGYTSAPSVTPSSGSATFVATVSNGSVTTITITNPGTYSSVPTLTISGGGGSGASATVTLMPTGIEGTTIETYQQRVWVGNNDQGSVSAPGSVSDFSSTSGGTSFKSTDSFLRRAYIAYKQTNGFLYLLGDSSINQISNVSTGGSPVATTFTNNNVDPQQGTPWPGSVQLFSRNIVFANSNGVYVCYGGAVTKVSDPLDGIYNTVPSHGPITPTGAIAEVFGIVCYVLLLPIVDPYTSQTVNKLLMFDGKKWWTTDQEQQLTFIATQEIDAFLTAYGSDGSTIWPLFQTPSTGFQKVIQSKFFANPSYLYTKTATRLYGVLANNLPQDYDLSVQVESDLGSNTYVIAAPGGPRATWTDAAGDEADWTTSSGQPAVWGAGATIGVFGPYAVGAEGSLIGMTAISEASDLTLISLSALTQHFTART